MAFEALGLRQVAGLVVIEVADEGALVQQACDVRAIAPQRDVEDGNFIACSRIHTANELDIALDAGDQCRRARVG
ncbi:MAG: hypothetical protein MUF16_28365 [Burkholderiaceae bacterium]|nr:hypothetical protein [Burkholderiaceae bacterium]